MSFFTVYCARSLLADVDGLEGEGGMWMPPVDVYETETHLVVEVELPGTMASQIRITCHEDALLIEGVKGETVRQVRTAVERFLRVERAAGPFRRLVELPGPVAADRGRARFRAGVLTVSLPKVGSSLRER